MIKRRTMKLGRQVHCTKISPEFEFVGQRLRSPGTKNEKLSSHPHCQCIARRAT